MPPAFQEVDGLTRRFDAEKTDIDQQWEMSVDKSIIAWEGFSDRNKKEILCTKENKLILMEMDSPVFRDFYDAKMKALKETEAARAEDEKKLLSGG